MSAQAAGTFSWLVSWPVRPWPGEGREAFPRLRLRCKEQNANTEADLVRLAEQVLPELAGEIRA